MLYQRFRVQEQIGVGLYGEVWLCQDTHNQDALVAVKRVSLARAHSALLINCGMDNPWNERRIMTKLQRLEPHENVLQIQAEFVEGNTWHLVMEYCTHGDLLQLLESVSENRLPERLAMRYFRQVVHGLAFLHRNGIAHRDLSLENVLIVENEVCKIGDFGLAVEIDCICNQCVGKAHYMAPEIVAQETYNPAIADMWSLGILLFIMLTGSPLAPNASIETTVFVVLQNAGVAKILEAWDLRDIVSSLTVELLDSLLQIDPVKRFTIEDVLVHPSIEQLA